jgi:hypothetical protein
MPGPQVPRAWTRQALPHRRLAHMIYLRTRRRLFESSAPRPVKLHLLTGGRMQRSKWETPKLVRKPIGTTAAGLGGDVDGIGGEFRISS